MPKTYPFDSLIELIHRKDNVNTWASTYLSERADVTNAEHAYSEVAVEVDDVQRARTQRQQYQGAKQGAEQLKQYVHLFGHNTNE